ncbi:hypothetical protein LTR96_011179 [Exophiala xenobiotica]|nr:hypothetical protein LTR72_011116 [Exophiala xenobiotica]KAK5263418.1 hypothetical protein LTR96_011179 [Exophiala xenobiotica]KAK5284808.1 hypothetical protein LTR14_011482 [Exophiala xenobiotica]KAK5332912.1 hypothetical protein LTR98_010962 [Exophiala xenobiotica]KAK5468990.1 hypothetical protein LTR55_011484 [Exophiala xenobiotica]
MPVFQETSNAARDLRILPSTANPVPRLSPTDEAHASSKDHYEVVVIGAGPAGLFLTLYLARYVLTDDSLLCLIAKPGSLRAGQADGLQPRTLEVLKSLGVVGEILSEGCHMTEVAFWNPDLKGGIERTNFAPDVTVAARYRHEVTIHQGRIERILEENLGLYSKRRVVRSSHFLDFKIDPTGHRTYPVLIDIEQETSEGERLTRLYVQVKDDEVAPDTELSLDRVKSSVSSREKCAAITLEYIMEQAQRVLKPYKLGLKKGAVVDWWAAYQIGQRMAPGFSLKDDQGVERVFIVGDGKKLSLHQNEI